MSPNANPSKLRPIYDESEITPRENFNSNSEKEAYQHDIGQRPCSPPLLLAS